MRRGLFELHAEDPARVDRLLRSRRRFLRAALPLAAMPFARFLPAGVIPLAWSETAAEALLVAKPGLDVLNDRPLNAETPAHLLDDEVTPASRLFVRNNGSPPSATSVDEWTLRVHGESCARPRSFSVAELRREFVEHRYQLQLECGGNGRAEFRPRTPGNQWTTGAVGCPEWTGVRLRDVLGACGVRDDAVYVAYRGADRHLSGDPGKSPISRGVPIAKALEDESLLAFEMNGAPIPAVHGAPLRMVCGGWPGSVSGKWVTELMVRDRVHDGAKMTGASYRIPCRPVAPGETVADEEMCIIESMPVKSLITFPQSGVEVPARQPLALRGHTWAGDLAVSAVDVSVDFGATWQAAQLAAPRNRLAWQRWQASVALPSAGYFEVWARARDTAGREQPMVVPGWNPKGYLNNACHRIAVRAV
jgi:DMSO/TMAO reductase YedYZ molybdopterin-dependent catalytic subunit